MPAFEAVSSIVFAIAASLTSMTHPRGVMLAGAFTNIVSFGTDRAGNLYIVDFDGEIFVLEPGP